MSTNSLGSQQPIIMENVIATITDNDRKQKTKTKTKKSLTLLLLNARLCAKSLHALSQSSLCIYSYLQGEETEAQRGSVT